MQSPFEAILIGFEENARMGLPAGGRTFPAQDVHELFSFLEAQADAIFDWHPLQLDTLTKSTILICSTPQLTPDRVLAPACDHRASRHRAKIGSR